MGASRSKLATKARRALAVGLCATLWLGTAISSSGLPAQSQNQSTKQSRSYDLARENISQVEASAREIRTTLLKDTGLMVELKRWVAKDATEHGQIVGESDVTDDAIFDRLE